MCVGGGWGNHRESSRHNPNTENSLFSRLWHAWDAQVALGGYTGVVEAILFVEEGGQIFGVV